MIEVSPNFAIGYYVIILLGYLIYKTMKVSPSGGGDQEVVTPVIGSMFIAGILIGEFMISIGMIKTVCGFEQWGFGALVTFVPWILITGLIKFILMIRPGWLTPFSNTIGYFLSSAIFGLTTAFRELLKPKNLDPTSAAGAAAGAAAAPPNGDAKDVAKALQQIYDDDSLLINQFTPENVEETIRKFSSVGLMYTPSEYQKEHDNDPAAGIVYNKYVEAIKKAVWFKLFVSEFIWLLMAGILTISITFNYIVNYGCKMTPDQISKANAKLAAVNAAEADNKRNNPPTIRRTTE
jgi:hypothetical protein